MKIKTMENNTIQITPTIIGVVVPSDAKDISIRTDENNNKIIVDGMSVCEIGKPYLSSIKCKIILKSKGVIQAGDKILASSILLDEIPYVELLKDNEYKIHGTSTLPELEFDFEPIMGKEELKSLIQKAISDAGLLLINPIDIKGQTFSNEHQNKWQESESKVIRGKLLIIEKIIIMSRYISKLPEPIRVLAEKRRSECPTGTNSDELDVAFTWRNTPEKYEFWVEIKNGNYSVFYDLYPQRDKSCTCNSRTVYETFSNVIHSDECELSGNTRDKLDELIEWIDVEIIWHKGCESDLQVINAYETILTKAKELKTNKMEYLSKKEAMDKVAQRYGYNDWIKLCEFFISIEAETMPEKILDEVQKEYEKLIKTNK